MGSDSGAIAMVSQNAIAVEVGHELCRVARAFLSSTKRPPSGCVRFSSHARASSLLLGMPEQHFGAWKQAGGEMVSK
jgi:hypothetical protein